MIQIKLIFLESGIYTATYISDFYIVPEKKVECDLFPFGEDILIFSFKS